MLHLQDVGAPAPVSTLLPESQEPIRAELFSPERLEQHAERLAGLRTLAEGTRGRPLSPRMRDSGRVLLQCYRAMAAAIGGKGALTPAAEWFLDNYHVVDETLRSIQTDLPDGFYRQIPKLADGPLAGYPRVLRLFWAFVAHTDSRFEPEALHRFVRGFQRAEPLTMGELWAVPIALRMVLVENLRRLAEHIVQARAARHEADALANDLLGLGGRPARPLAFQPLEAAALPITFAVQLVQRLREEDPRTTPALQWLDDRLAALGTSPDDLVRVEHQSQAAMNVTVRNIITSMRTMSKFDWAEFFESVSLVDEALRADSPFGTMDFATRDRYRHEIEALARGSKRSELDVARQAIARAKGAARAAPRSGAPATDRSEDPGYYLIAKGRPLFEADIGYRVPLQQRLLRAFVSGAMPRYLATLGVVTGLLIAAALLTAHTSGAGPGALMLLGLLAVLPASDLAIALINRAVMKVVGPRPLPRLELSGGVPKDLRTVVVVPTLLTSEGAIEEQVHRLEIHYLANPDGDIRFAVLSDWTDAPTETMPDDDRLLAAAIGGIARLNRRHGPTADGEERFLLLHRRRIWNEEQSTWMGWERKRGKLHELNRLLRGANDTTFIATDGRAPAAPADVRYVITLDADTRLPRNAARRLVGTIAHRLNQPAFDDELGRVVDGHAVLQPRITPTMPTDRLGSLFQRIFSGPAGVDPYAGAVSDVYQDLFSEGSYTGKGIYDVDAFAAALAGRVPENSLLSHDLFEGIFARAGLVTDIELFEEFPSHYEVAAARQHRWARGDWQLLPWIIAGVTAGTRRRRIPLIGVWKMLDNLRRSISAPAAWLTLVACWTLPGGSPLVWTTFVLVAMALPALLPAFGEVIPTRSGISKRTHLRAAGKSFALAASQIALNIAFLAHQAWLMGDALVRTLVRLHVTHRRRLEWVTAAQSKSGSALDVRGMYRRMASAPILAVAAGALVALIRPESGAIATPFVLLWALSPLVARWVSQPPRTSPTPSPSPADARLFRAMARRTWRFFEAFVGPEDNFLPPDNFQEDPKLVLAHRTSPTNIGLSLLATLAARDLGWLGTLEAVERIEATLATMRRLERFRGHFYNWYDTVDLRPLEPRYVSTVDSGNLAGHLLVLGNACREVIDRPLLDREAFAGIEDAVALVQEAARLLADDRRNQTVTLADLHHAAEALAASLRASPVSLTDRATHLHRLAAQADTLVDITRTLTAESQDGANSDVVVWAQAARATIASHAHDLETIAPWAPHLAAALTDLSNPCPEAVRAIEILFSSSPTLAGVADACHAAMGDLTALRASLVRESAAPGGGVARIDEMLESLERSSVASGKLVRRLLAAARVTRELFDAMQFAFLFDPARKLLSIGYRVEDGGLDPSEYDLLASEARLTSFIAVAKGDVPASHWFRLGRPMTPIALGSALVSWSGSMFEYLMPALVMHSPPGSLLDQTYHLVVRRQMSYGAEHGVPWGISESAYNVRDLDLTYQYSNFGVPGLGLERGLSEDLVVAPYASALAAMVDPVAAARNLSHLVEAGARGPYGFYEALDYTRARLPEGSSVAIVRTYMAHHHRDRQRSARRRDADAVSQGTHRPGHGSPPAGARSARRGRRPPARGRGADAGPRPRFRGADLPAIHVPAPPGAPDALAVQWAIRGHADGGWLGLQPLHRPGHHTVARGRDARSLGHVHLPARPAERSRLVGGISTDRRRAGRLSRHLLRRPCRVSSTRRGHHDHPGGARITRR